jgi:flagellar basal-body rod protein FlgC
MDNQLSAMSVAASAMRAQGARLKITSENLANADSPDYHRKLIMFGVDSDKEQMADHVEVKKILPDGTPARLSYDPSNPLADEKGYVKLSNVNPLIEMMDAKEAQRSYEASMNMFQQARSMYSKTIDMMRD